jgi:hypothetical protein
MLGAVVRRVLPLALAVGFLVSCSSSGSSSDEDSEAARRTEFPSEYQVFIDQNRLQRRTRTVFVRFVNGGDKMMTVRRAEISSERFGKVTWDEEDKTFHNEADLEFEMPPGRCGTGSDATVEVTYRVEGESEDRVSTVEAKDRYGEIGFFLDRDCAERTLREAADLEVGEPQVTGEGKSSHFLLPVTMSPTGERDDVHFLGFSSTVLFRSIGPWAQPDVDVPLGPDDPVAHVTLEIVPGRCDGHALADDKVGRLFDVRIKADGLPEASSFYLPLTDEQRVAMFTFLKMHCGLPAS